jgi:hypothetical protein
VLLCSRPLHSSVSAVAFDQQKLELNDVLSFRVEAFDGGNLAYGQWGRAQEDLPKG